MKLINATKGVMFIPLGSQTLTVMPKNVSEDVIASKALISSLIKSYTPKEVGFVVYSSAELQIINDFSGAAPFLYDNLDDAIKKLLPEGVSQITETRVISAGTTVMSSVESSEHSLPEGPMVCNNSEALEKAKIELQKVTEENSNNKALIETLSSENKTLKEEKASLERALSEKELAIVELKQTSTSSNTDEVETLNKKLNDLEKVKTLLEEKNSESLTEISKLEKEKEDLSALIASKNSLIEELKKSSEKAGEIPVDVQKELEKGKQFRELLQKTVSENNLEWDKERQGYYAKA